MQLNGCKRFFIGLVCVSFLGQTFLANTVASAQDNLPPSQQSNPNKTVPETLSAETSQTVDSTDINSAVARQYTLGPGDAISVGLFGYPDLTHAHMKVQPDGKLIFDIIGPIYVQGLTMDQLYDRLNKEYGRLYKNPRISLELVETKPFEIYVTGAVISPGSYEVITNSLSLALNQSGIPLNRSSPLLSNVLVAAGGITYDADLANIRIENRSKHQIVDVNLYKLLSRNEENSDVYLIPGDAVYVPRLPVGQQIPSANYQTYASSSFSPRSVPVKVIGYVSSPGLVNLNSALSLNVMSAISAAGGFKDQAYFPEKVLIFRPQRDPNGTQQPPIKIDPQHTDFQLQPNDVVFVPQKAIPRLGLFFDYMTRVITPFYLGANAYRGATGNNIINGH